MSTLNGSPSGRPLRHAFGSIGSVASIRRASFLSLAFSASSARSRREGLRLIAIDPSYPEPGKVWPKASKTPVPGTSSPCLAATPHRATTSAGRCHPRVSFPGCVAGKAQGLGCELAARRRPNLPNRYRCASGALLPITLRTAGLIPGALQRSSPSSWRVLSRPPRAQQRRGARRSSPGERSSACGRAQVC